MVHYNNEEKYMGDEVITERQSQRIFLSPAVHHELTLRLGI